MTPGQLLSRLGPLLFGDQWKSAMDRRFKFRAGRFDEWSKDRGEPPFGIWRQLAGLVQDRRQGLAVVQSDVLDMMESRAPHEQEIVISAHDLRSMTYYHHDNPVVMSLLESKFEHFAEIALTENKAILLRSGDGFIVRLRKTVGPAVVRMLKAWVVNEAYNLGQMADPQDGNSSTRTSDQP